MKHGNLTSTLYTGPISILNGHFSLMDFSISDALLNDWKRRYMSLSNVKENSLRPKYDWSHPGCFPSINKCLLHNHNINMTKHKYERGKGPKHELGYHFHKTTI